MHFSCCFYEQLIDLLKCVPIQTQYKSSFQFNLQFSGSRQRMSGVVSIQGNLGAGKSTLLSLLNIQVIKEPVDEWEHLGGSSILKRYYEDPKRWAFTFQLNALHSRQLIWTKVIKQQPNQLHFSERSPLADRHVFGEIMYQEGNLDKAEYQIYDQLTKKLMRECPIRAIIYLKCDPEVCLQRIKQRNRQGEQGIPIDYLRKVHMKHEEWLNSIKEVPILVIDTGVYDIYQPEQQQEVVGIIREFIKELRGKMGQEGKSSPERQIKLKEKSTQKETEGMKVAISL